MAAFLAALAAVTALLPSTAGAESSKSLRQQLDEVLARLDAAETSEGVASDRYTKVNREVARTERVLATASGRITQRLRTMYMNGIGGDQLVTMLTAGGPQLAIDRASLLDAATRHDRAQLLSAAVLRRQLRMKQAEAAGARRTLDGAEALLRAEQRRLVRLLGIAERADSARRVRARASRNRTFLLDGANYSCAVGPAHAFSNTWGARRSGGRRHKGTDVFASNRAPAYAVTDGVITKWRSGGLGGIALYLRGDDGNTYYYAHNASNIARPGRRVQAGELIARVGNTGNARGGASHIHFELHPGARGPVNPYFFLRRVCG